MLCSMLIPNGEINADTHAQSQCTLFQTTTNKITIEIDDREALHLLVHWIAEGQLLSNYYAVYMLHATPQIYLFIIKYTICCCCYCLLNWLLEYWDKKREKIVQSSMVWLVSSTWYVCVSLTNLNDKWQAQKKFFFSFLLFYCNFWLVYVSKQGLNWTNALDQEVKCVSLKIT